MWGCLRGASAPLFKIFLFPLLRVYTGKVYTIGSVGAGQHYDIGTNSFKKVAK